MKTRRDFLKLSGLGIAGTFTLKSNTFLRKTSPGYFKSDIPFELGIASYTFRKYNLDDTLRMTRRVGIKNIAFKSFHLELDASDEEIKQTVQKVKEAGLNLYGGGVIYMREPEEVDNAFEYAKKAGMKTIIGVPDPDRLDVIDSKVKEYDIQVAIHNHGPGDETYPTPESIYTRIKDLDPRIGICIDVGHTQRIGADPVADTERFFDRILDVHIKDVSEASPEGKECEVGRGVIDIPGILKVLVKKGFTGMASFEYEKDPEDLLPGLAESVGYVRGILDMIK